MVGRRRKSGRKLAASPQRSWLWGRNAVLETLTAGRWLPRELRAAIGIDADLLDRVTALTSRLQVPLTEHPAEQLTAWCRTAEHQGLLAQMPPFPYVSADEAIAAASGSPLFVVLDRIQDPHNFGAILRSAEVFGVDAVFVAEQGQCEVTPHVARSSAGGVNFLRIARAPDLCELVRRLRSERGVHAVATAADGSLSAGEEDFRRPAALVIGNEGTGVAGELLAACSSTVRIPQRGRVGSLNAAVATGVLLYEANRQRGVIEKRRTADQR